MPMTKEKFDDHLKQIEKTYSDLLAALFRAYPEFDRRRQSGLSVEDEKESVTQLLREFIKEHQGSFTLNHARRWIVNKDITLTENPRLNVLISNTLGRLHRSRKLKRISRSGEKPIVYQGK